MNEKNECLYSEQQMQKKERIDIQELQKRRIQIQQKKNKSHNSQ